MRQPPFSPSRPNSHFTPLNFVLQIANGVSAEVADGRVAGNDLPNALLVAEGAPRAAVVVRADLPPEPA